MNRCVVRVTEAKRGRERGEGRMREKGEGEEAEGQRKVTMCTQRTEI